MPLDANALGRALTLRPYLDPRQPLDIAKGLWDSLVQYPHDVYTGQQQATPEGATNFALSTFSGGPGMAVKGGLGSAGGRLGAAQPKPFFSALQKGVEAAPLKTAPGEQWLGTLRNMPGVKPDELNWTGFHDWLTGKPSVTKQEATDYLNQNKVELGEVMKGAGDQPLTAAQYEAFARQRGFNWDDPVQRRDAVSEIDSDRIVAPTKYHQYQLPGGENYREMLLTLPKRETNKNAAALYAKRWQSERRDPTPQERQEFQRLAQAEDAQAGQDFHSSHYSEPNVLAHMRFNDRIDAQGRKTLFVEEIQSDWHQKGRKQGYAGAAQDPLFLTAKRKLSEAGVPFSNEDAANAMHDGIISREEFQAFRNVEAGNNSVPDAPFKKDWHELALKRMIKHAVDNGYDSVSWTPGKVQAERYDLSKHIDALHVSKNLDGTYDLGAVQPGRRRADNIATRVPENKLSDHIGKELAEKIVKDGLEIEGEHVYSGLDLRVGGEGMNAFYDKILPNAANKLGKKYGAKVGVTHISRSSPQFLKYFREQHGREYRGDANESQEVWTLPITDAMRKEVGPKGVPLFTGGSPLGAAAMGAQQKLSPDQARKYLTGGLL